eukprot:1181836-Prorocentrum_minimum.AAC.1
MPLRAETPALHCASEPPHACELTVSHWMTVCIRFEHRRQLAQTDGRDRGRAGGGEGDGAGVP